MANTRLPAPMRGFTSQITRCSVRQNASPIQNSKLPRSTPARSIATSASPKAAVSSITTSVSSKIPIPLQYQKVLATIHHFPSLEPLRFENYPANHLYLPTRRDILHRAVIYEGDKTRLGTASTKTRYEVRGSSKKIRPQKGSGRARLGDKKSPMLRGGGVSHGPTPRDFSTGLQKKVYDLAWRTALSYRFRKGELIIVDNAMEIESPSTRLMEDVFRYHEKLRGRGRSLMVTLERRPLLQQALQEMDRDGQSLTWEEVDVKDLLERAYILIERHALNNILTMHQEDLTHRSVHPNSRRLCRIFVPKELESLAGWKEFRNLALTKPENLEKARPDLYESAASARYSLAESLGKGPKSTRLTASAYRLNAEARKMRFAQKTGLPFQNYNDLLDEETGEFDPMIFPRIQALTYQMIVKNEKASQQAETSREKGEQFMVEVKELETQKLEILHDAAVLAAEVHEHVAQAQALEGVQDISEATMAQASLERANVDQKEVELLEARVDLAKQKVLVAGLIKDFEAKKKAQEEVETFTAQLEKKNQELEAQSDELEAGEEEIEAARIDLVAEQTKDEKK